MATGPRIYVYAYEGVPCVAMIFGTPPTTAALAHRLAEFDELRQRLEAEAGIAGPWLGSLRRQWRASSAESSIEIEGFHVPQDNVMAVASGEEVPDPNDDDRMALSSYARAMDHVGVMSHDPVFKWVDRVILDLHFDACYFQKDKDPGQYRRRGIEVARPGGGPPAYVGPPHETVPELMREVVEWLGHGDLDAHVAVRAAMAHLHLVSVHPFRDGKGRVSRIVQSLVLAREGLRHRNSSQSRNTSGSTPTRITQRCKRSRVGRTSPSATPAPGSHSVCRLISSRLGGDSISSRTPALDGRCSRTWSRSEDGQIVSSSRLSRACSMASIARHICPKPTSLRRRQATTSDGCWMLAS
jgi:hypothetical protein